MQGVNQEEAVLCLCDAQHLGERVISCFEAQPVFKLSLLCSYCKRQLADKTAAEVAPPPPIYSVQTATVTFGGFLVCSRFHFFPNQAFFFFLFHDSANPEAIFSTQMWSSLHQN